MNIFEKVTAALPVKNSDRVIYQPNRNPLEYPLFTETAKQYCPSARYVGGVSRWLCECSDRTTCKGVIMAELLAGGVSLTRRDYMDGLKDLDGTQRHKLYYRQFVTPAVVVRVIDVIGLRAIMEASDPHLNDIALSKWDVIGLPSDSARLIARANVFTYAALTKPGYSQADQVCVNKQAAGIIKETLSILAVGSSHFKNSGAVNAYYSSYGFNQDDINEKVKTGEVAIGRPDIINGQWLTLDSDDRYTINSIK